MRVLAIDYGTKHIGLAVSDTAHIAAHPYKTLENKGLPHFVKELQKILVTEEVSTIVMGRPINMKGRATLFTKEVDTAAAYIHHELGHEPVMIDERLTSRQALGIHDKGSRAKKDTRAAQIILETYLATEPR
jgi:putative Holliday junction resolvase